MNKSDLRPVVFDILRKTPQTHFRAVENDVRSKSDDYERRDVLTLNEVLWDLLLQGVLAPGKNSLNPDLPFVHVTEYGARCLEDGAIVAHDPDRYIDRLTEHIGGRANPIVVESAREGLLSYLGGRYAAALVLLAHAGECVVGEIIEALIQSGKSAGRGTKRLEACRRAPGRQSATIRAALLGRRPPEEIASVAESQLSGLRAAIRLARSEDGSPRVPPVDRDLTLAYFLLFLDQCRFAYHAIGWLNGESIA